MQHILLGSLSNVERILCVIIQRKKRSIRLVVIKEILVIDLENYDWKVKELGFTKNSPFQWVGERGFFKVFSASIQQLEGCFSWVSSADHTAQYQFRQAITQYVRLNLIKQ